MVVLSIKRKIGRKGQVVIPKIFRDSMNIQPGDEVLMEFTEEGILIKPSEKPEVFIEKFCSIIDRKRKLTRELDIENLIEEEFEDKFGIR